MTKEEIQKEIDDIMAERLNEEDGCCNCGDPSYEEKSQRLRQLKVLLKKAEDK